MKLPAANNGMAHMTWICVPSEACLCQLQCLHCLLVLHLLCLNWYFSRTVCYYDIECMFSYGRRVLSLNSLGARRGLVVNFSDLQELLNGCSQLEVGYNLQMVRFHSLITSVPTDWHSHLVSLLHESRKACWSTPSVYNCPINKLKSTDIESLWYT